MTEPVAKLKQPLTALGPKHEAVLACLVHGMDDGKPMSVIETADKLKVRRAYVRDLLADPLFKVKYQSAIANMRAAYAPQAVATMAEIMIDPGEGTSKDKAVRLSAAKGLLGEDAKGFSVNVGVQVNNQTNVALRPGYVLDLSARKRLDELAERPKPTRDEYVAGLMPLEGNAE